ncbi:MAG TPA: zinc ribbon domain-containing protein [Dehalococcoidia bacterium]|nr:zinc ribbon domain-containing protein [Dehalococcoidia bacterium]
MPAEPDPQRLEEIVLSYRTLAGECGSCRAAFQPDWQFCAHCGVRLATACPACGVPLPPLGATHCGACGIELPHRAGVS